MKPTTTVRKRTFMPSLNLAHIAALVAVGSVAVAMAPAGCIGGWDYSNVPEGDRCNPYDSHNECAGSDVCTVSAWQVANQGLETPQGNTALFLAAGAGIDSAGNYTVLQFCPENYCCPVDSNGDLLPSGNGNPNCQPGCNGGAAAICTAQGDTTPYGGVCEFADSGVLPSATPDAGGSATPDAGGSATPDAGGSATPDAGGE
jgi:hypothetical protein